MFRPALVSGDAYADRAKRIAPRYCEGDALEKVVAQLREIQRRTGIDRTLAIGQLVLNEFFGGNASLWKDRKRNKNNSIRRLAEREDCPFCKSALNEAIGVNVAVVSMPSVRTFGHVTASHIAAVLVLPESERPSVLETAERENWSVRDTKQKVVELRRRDGEKRGRPSASEQERVLTLLRSGLSSISAAVAHVNSLGRTSERFRDGVAQVVVDLARESDSLEQWLDVPAPSSRRSDVMPVGEAKRQAEG